MKWTKSIWKVSWPLVPKPTEIQFESHTELEMRMRRWWTERGSIFSIGRSPWRNIPKPISVKTCNLSIEDYASNTNSMEEVETKYLAIRAWWMSLGAETEQALPLLELGLAFWHFCYRQSSGFMELVSLYLPLFFLSSSFFDVQLH